MRLSIRHRPTDRCPECHRALPGALDRIPRWPVYGAVVGSLVYPSLRLIWVFGGALGTTTGEADVEPVLAWSLIAASSTLVAFAVLLLIGRGPTWLRALLGFGGLVAGASLAAVGGLGTAMVFQILMTEGPQASAAGLTIWTFLAVYGSWFVTGLGVIAGSWRYWAHRRDDCATCRQILA